MESRLPNLPNPDVSRKFYGGSSSNELLIQLLTAQDLFATTKSQLSSQKVMFIKICSPCFCTQSTCVVVSTQFSSKKGKLAPKWSGPHRIAKLKNDNNVELKVWNGRALIEHANCLKPFHIPLSNANSSAFRDSV